MILYHVTSKNSYDRKISTTWYTANINQNIGHLWLERDPDMWHIPLTHALGKLS